MNMEELKSKAKLVASENMTEPLTTITFASIVSCVTVDNALMIATLNNLKVMQQMS